MHTGILRMLGLLSLDFEGDRKVAFGVAFSWCLRFGLAILFGYAGIVKMVDPVGFAEAIANYRIIPPKLVPWFASTVPSLEVVLALCLFKSSLTHAASLMMSALMLTFCVLAAQAWFRDLNIDCGCFGTQTPLDGWTLVRDLAFLACCVTLSWKTRSWYPQH
jgi:putative oxidoreductase